MIARRLLLQGGALVALATAGLGRGALAASGFEVVKTDAEWKAILSPARESAHEKVTPQWASRICSKYLQLRYGDMNEFRDRYHTLIGELEDALDAIIASDRVLHRGLQDRNYSGTKG